MKPVASGYRVTLTYHLLYRGADGDRASIPPPAAERLAASVEAYFSTPVVKPYARSAPAAPDRLIYLLDHSYTEKSLGWSHLKNADRLRVAALKQVAERLGCEAYLALADVHECWSCEDDWDGRYGRRYGSRYDNDSDEDDEDAEDHELIELVDTDVELRHWVGPDGNPARGVASAPEDHEVCFTRASVEMDPFKSEHEGYTGNAGNTIDRWYHRAALVMWPRDRTFVVRAKMSPSWAVDQLARRVAAGAADEARARAKQLLPFWSASAPKEPSESFVLRLFTLLASLDDAALALGLLSPLGPHRLSLHTTPAFVALVERHGLAWAQGVFFAWAANVRYDTPPWLPFLPRLCEALMAGGEQGEAVAEWLVAHEVAAFEKNYGGKRSLPEIAREEVANRDIDALAALMEAAHAVRSPCIRDGLIAFLVAPGTALPLTTAGALLQQIRAARTPKAARVLGLGALYDHLVRSLEAALAVPVRSPDDWSIKAPLGCGCALCKELATFLRDRERVRFAWPLAKERRRHVHGVIDLQRLPVTHATVRSGSPQTLVLTKQKALFEDEGALRARQKTLRAWLGKQRSAFSDAPRARPRRRGLRRSAALGAEPGRGEPRGRGTAGQP